MTKNMNNLDRGLRALVVAPAAVIAAVLVGAGSIGGIGRACDSTTRPSLASVRSSNPEIEAVPVPPRPVFVPVKVQWYSTVLS